MKTVVLIRHAKSGWDDPNLTDYERTLNERGLRDAPFIAEQVAKLIPTPDLMIASGAVRAWTTANIFVDKLNYPKEKLIKDDRIYESGPKYIVKLLTELNDESKFVVIVGHNPDITSLVSFFSGSHFSNMPTCGVVCLDFKTEKWSEINKDNGTIRFFEYPKKY